MWMLNIILHILECLICGIKVTDCVKANNMQDSNWELVIQKNKAHSCAGGLSIVDRKIKQKYVKI